MILIRRRGEQKEDVYVGITWQKPGEESEAKDIQFSPISLVVNVNKTAFLKKLYMENFNRTHAY